MPWDQGLEGPSLQIAASDHSPLRVRAGPGTGKTFTLIRRIARLLENGTRPRQILVSTFTRTAAGDLKQELERLDVEGAASALLVETTERKRVGIEAIDPAIRASSTGGAAC